MTSLTPSADTSQDFVWDVPDKVLREVLGPYTDDLSALRNMTRAQLQAELKQWLKDSVGC